MNANIIRPAKEEAQQRDYFQGLENRGLTSYASRGSYEKWHWQYCRNPFLEGENLPSWVYEIEGNKAGHLGVIPVEVNAGSRKIKAGWAVDFFTSSEYRKKGIGRSLVEEAGRGYDLLLTLGQTDMSFNLFIKMGWRFLGCLPYYAKIWDIRPLIEKKIKNNFIVNITASLINPFLAVYNLLKKPRNFPEISVDIIGAFGEEADLFWQELAPCYKIAVPRDRSYLSWKYDMHPDAGHIKLRAARNNKVCGYMALRCLKYGLNRPEGMIVDIVACPDDNKAIQALLFRALEYFRKENCGIVRCFVNQKKIEKTLNMCGFLKRKPYMRFLINRKIDGIEGIDDLANWHLMAGDCDIDR